MQKSIGSKQFMKHIQLTLQTICEKYKGYRGVGHSCSTTQPLALLDGDLV